jgi:thiamine pyrophosphokinase
MSSHHIVREKQEPALLVLGMDSFSDELLGQLLEWSPTVIVTEPMAEKLNAYGIKIDWIITDSHEDIQSDVKQLPLKGGSVINTAFEFLMSNSYGAVNVVTDELQLRDYLPFSDKINLVIFYNHQKIYGISSGFSKWKPAGEFIELLSQPADLKLTGLETVKAGQLKTTADGLFTIQFDEPFLFIAEDI